MLYYIIYCFVLCPSLHSSSLSCSYSLLFRLRQESGDFIIRARYHSVKWCVSFNNVAWKVHTWHLGRSKQMRTLSLECVPYKCILFDTSEDIINICIFIIYIFILFLYCMYAIRTNDAVLINVFCCVVAGSRWHHNILRADVQQLQDHRGRGAQGDTALNSKRGQ